MSVAGHGAATAEVWSSDEALITAAQQIQLVAQLLVDVAAQTHEQGGLDVGSGLVIRAGRVGSAAVLFGKLLISPRLRYRFRQLSARTTQPSKRLGH